MQIIKIFHNFIPPKPPKTSFAILERFCATIAKTSLIAEISKICKDSLSSSKESSMLTSIISPFPLALTLTSPAPLLALNSRFASSSSIFLLFLELDLKVLPF